MGTESRVTENETREFGMGDGMQPGFGNDGLLGDAWGCLEPCCSKCGSLVSPGSSLELQNLLTPRLQNQIPRGHIDSEESEKLHCSREQTVRAPFFTGLPPLLCDLAVSSFLSIPGSFVPGPGPIQ